LKKRAEQLRSKIDDTNQVSGLSIYDMIDKDSNEMGDDSGSEISRRESESGEGCVSLKSTRSRPETDDAVSISSIERRKFYARMALDRKSSKSALDEAATTRKLKRLAVSSSASSSTLGGETIDKKLSRGGYVKLDDEDEALVGALQPPPGYAGTTSPSLADVEIVDAALLCGEEKDAFASLRGFGEGEGTSKEGLDPEAGLETGA
jgi:hypothetical protein